ncbi:hypothetical protein ACFSQJ_11935 [Croceitalea marina]|uniref:Outer membrane protein beta-barrel domain-containing protein n=1 Tax=Croceitalea marina TaxID=1775166 RepID=A0ABW5MXY2_9FLAO
MQGLKFKIAFVLIFFVITSELRAQMEPPFLLPGVAATYSSNLETTGINARVYYGIDHTYCFGPEISYFRKSHEDNEVSLFEANANLHYIIDLNKGLGFYPLTGINYTIETKIENQGFEEEKFSENSFGLNIGAGFHYTVGRILFFTEYKYVISTLEDHFFTAGALLNFSLAKKGGSKQHN